MNVPETVGGRLLVIAGLIFLGLGVVDIVADGASWSAGVPLLAGVLLIGAVFTTER